MTQLKDQAGGAVMMPFRASLGIHQGIGFGTRIT